MISAGAGAFPSANSRLPSGARNETPRLSSSSHPFPASKPRAEKKLASLAYASGVSAGRTMVIPLIISLRVSREKLRERKKGRTSGAKARYGGIVYGTAEAVPFPQGPGSDAGSKADIFL